MNFTHIYSVENTQQSITTNENKRENQIAQQALTIWSHNIGGTPQENLAEGTELHTDITIKNPTIIAIQEHLQHILNHKQFNKIIQIKGYTLIAHSKANYIGKKEDGGRPSGGLAIWIRNDMVKNYKINIKQNTEYLQTLILKPNSNNKGITQTIQVINTYCRPNNKETAAQEINRVKKYIKNILQIQQENNTYHSIIIGDLNSKDKRTGDKTTQNRGKYLYNAIQQQNQISLNITKTYGQPTYIAINKDNTGQSIVDVAIIPKEQEKDWETLTITDPHSYAINNKKQKSRHHILYATSQIPIVINKPNSTYHYAINYNQYDERCLQQLIANRGTTVLEQITENAENTINQHSRIPGITPTHLEFSPEFWTI